MGNRVTEGSSEEFVKLSFFMEIGKAISEAKSIDETLNEVMRQIGAVFSPLDWSLLLKDPVTGDLEFTVVIGKNSDKLKGKRLPCGEGIAGWICENGVPVISEDVTKDVRFSSRIDRFTQFQTKSIIGVPLIAKGKVFGAIELINKIDGKPFTPFDLKILTTIADFSAIAIEKAYYYRTLKKMAVEDPLTGLNNRRSMEKTLAKEISLVKRYGTQLALLMLDIDHFKNINDTYGHPAGDQVLKTLAQVLAKTTREVDFICRYGGDEFIIIMPNTSLEDAEKAKKRITDAIDFQNSLGGEVKFTVSIGIHSVDSGESSGVLTLLDMDLYKQKANRPDSDVSDVGQNLIQEAMEEKHEIRQKESGRNPGD